MIKCILFDMDGTIADTTPLCIEAFRASIEPYLGRAIDDMELIRTFGPSEEGTIMAFIPDHFEEGVSLYLDIYQKLHNECPAPFAGIPELLRRLRGAGYFLGLITGKGIKSLSISLKKFALADAFDALYTGSIEGACKEKSMIAALLEHNFSPEEVVYIGDTVYDITASRSAGISVFAAAWAKTVDLHALQLACPDKILYSVDELSAIFLTDRC